jgi:uncharacterized membrane-anchored protein
VDADDFLSQMKANDEAANKERTKSGIATLRTVGWVQKPTFNDDLHTVSWIIEGENSHGGHIINAIALKLGRSGLERITWIIEPAKITSGMNDLLLAENAHLFDAGARYTDYVKSTDKAAEYGVAGLVAGALGVKLLKAGGIAAFLIGFKKLAFLLLIPFIWVGKKVKEAFSKTSP